MSLKVATMARTKKNKIFDLFKNDFKISFFYKPTMEINDEYYYIVLDDSIRLRMKIINGAVVIDSAVPITKSYVSPLFDKIVNTIMNQSKITVLISLIGDTYAIHQGCINHNAPIVEDEDYITVSYGMYQKWKSQSNDISNYGFYILSVSDEEPIKQRKPEKPKPVDVKQKPVNHSEKPKETKSNLNIIKNMLYDEFDNITIDDLTENGIQCKFTEFDKFTIEKIDNSLYIKELLENQDYTLNLVKIATLINLFEKFTNIFNDIYLVSIYNHEVYRLCEAKKYIHVQEDNKILVNKLFKQAFHGYGTYKIIINN